MYQLKIVTQPVSKVAAAPSRGSEGEGWTALVLSWLHRVLAQLGVGEALLRPHPIGLESYQPSSSASSSSCRRSRSWREACSLLVSLQGLLGNGLGVIPSRRRRNSVALRSASKSMIKSRSSRGMGMCGRRRPREGNIPLEGPSAGLALLGT